MNSHVLFHSVHQLSRQLAKHLNVALEPFGLYNAQWSVMYVLNENGTLTQRELCEYLGVEAPPMTRTIQRLSKQGYIEYVVGQDKRKKYIKLTEKAVKEYPLWEKAIMEANEKLLSSFPKSSQEALLTLVSTWLGKMKQPQSYEVSENNKGEIK
ncbi:MarR family transcriptional regulator [Bacillus sp. B15-48]|uniref:MarR family winged helix-turn-helix transcriptional regulator n=1 Tax=Bacillus sp. B15-48 TaxID=1548601 RepID=UPI00193F3D53|nr:MarR family transcriptional regulator [Bacillus sp. B15-48]MBM4765069.1 MarR family transcriptional regulator [Bacillus sp. B15-48]